MTGVCNSEKGEALSTITFYSSQVAWDYNYKKQKMQQKGEMTIEVGRKPFFYYYDLAKIFYEHPKRWLGIKCNDDNDNNQTMSLKLCT